jgi:chloride channel 3/4/5
MWQSFVCAMVAAVTLRIFNPFRTKQLVLYQVKYTTDWHGFEIFPFAFLGIIGGIYGGLFIKLNMKIAAWRKKARVEKYPVLEVFVVALITAIINFPNVFMRAQSSELVHDLFAECGAIPDDRFGICTASAYTRNLVLILTAVILGFLFASVTFGLKIPAGIILPSMAIGALYGRALGLFVERLHQGYPELFIFATCAPDISCVTPGTYAVVGAASALGGVTRLTVSIVVIMFELTGALTYVLPIMVAVMISKWVGDAFGKRGIYESWIHLNEYPFLDNRDDAIIPDIPVSQIMTRTADIATITSTGHTLQSLQVFLSSYESRGFPIVTDHSTNTLLGYISRTELASALQSITVMPQNMPLTTEVYFTHQPSADPLSTVDLRPWMDQTPITLNAKSTLQLTVDMFQKLGLKYVLFCEKGALKGLLTKKDIWYVLNSVSNNTAEDNPVTPRADGPNSGSELLADMATPILISPFDQR